MIEQLNKEEVKINSNEAISRMINSINANSLSDFYKIADQYVSTLSVNGEHYGRIKRSINQKPAKLLSLSELPSDLKKLITVENEKDQFTYLNPNTSDLISELMSEWENREVYKFHNLTVRNKILLHGPTGNGKTTIARHVAKLSGLPFVEVSSDMMIDSKIGSTGQNIRKVFNNITEPCLIFWDEIDSVGRTRGKSNGSADTENERMVNSILVNIEKLNNDVVFIAATNRIEIIDPAFLRRFDVKFLIPNPSLSDKENYTKSLFNFYKVPSQNLLLNMYDNFSQIKDVIIDIARKHVISELSKKG